MFFIPTGIWQKTPGLTVGLYIWKGIIPAGLGNIVGGGLFVATLYWYLHLHDQPPVSIDGKFYDQPSESLPTFIEGTDDSLASRKGNRSQ
jgi:hypothetical protein